MIEHKYGSLEQKVLEMNLSNGLKIYIVLDDSKKHYYVNFGVLYGSNDIEFIPVNKSEYVKSPLGVAHFLEHKVFEMADGSDPFSFFSKSGTYVNAGTNYYSTRYYMWGTKDFASNLDYLINMVLLPYFTDSNVLKEKGIIQEEIKMYDDDPGWIIEDNLRRNVFHSLYVKEKIAGSIESIDEINKDILYECYNTFYQANNMVLIIGGNVSPDEILSVLNQNKAINNLAKGHDILRKKIEEDESVREEYQAVETNIIVPKLKYAFKINKEKFSVKDPIKLNMYLNCIFSTLFGNTSKFYEDVYLKKLTNGYYYEHAYYDKYYVLNIEAESDKADLFKDYVDEVLNNIIIGEEDLTRQKKIWLASEIRLSDHIDVLSDGIFDDIICYGKPCFNRIKKINDLNIDELNQVINELDLTNNSFILLLPSKKMNM